MKQSRITQYNQKVVKSGDYIEVYIFEKEVISGYTRPGYRRRNTTSYKRRSPPSKQSLRNLRRIILANFRPYETFFLSVSYAEIMRDEHQAKKDIKNFLRRLKRHINKSDIKYTIVMEFQQTGSIHFHLLLYNFLENEYEVPYLDEREIAELWGLGTVNLQKVISAEDIHRVAFYVTKSNVLNQAVGKLYYHSMNLQKPEQKLNQKPGSFKQRKARISNEEDYGNLLYERVFKNAYRKGKYYLYRLPSED